MKVKFKFLKWVWKKLPPALLINTFTMLPHGVIRHLGPVSVTIEPTTACNFSCPLCPRTKLSNRKHGTMNFDNFKKVVDTMPWTVRVLELYLMGEPLLAPDIFKMIKYATGKGYHVRISTNASYLEKFTNQLLDSNLTELVVAVDGATEGTYKQYRVGGDFMSVTRGIKHFTSEKRKKNLKHPSVVFQFIVMKHNEHEIEAIKQLAKDLGVDHLIFKRVSLMDNTRERELQKNLKERYLPTDERFIRPSFKRRRIDPCRWAFSAMVLQDGNMTSCCYDWDGKLQKGNTFVHGFKKIFQSREYTQIRKAIIGQQLRICKDCDYNTQVTERIF